MLRISCLPFSFCECEVVCFSALLCMRNFHLFFNRSFFSCNLFIHAFCYVQISCICKMYFICIIKIFFSFGLFIHINEIPCGIFFNQCLLSLIDFFDLFLSDIVSRRLITFRRHGKNNSVILRLILIIKRCHLCFIIFFVPVFGIIRSKHNNDNVCIIRFTLFVFCTAFIWITCPLHQKRTCFPKVFYFISASK